MAIDALQSRMRILAREDERMNAATNDDAAFLRASYPILSYSSPSLVAPPRPARSLVSHAHAVSFGPLDEEIREFEVSLLDAPLHGRDPGGVFGVEVGARAE